MITQEDLTKDSTAKSISLEQLAQGEKVPTADLGELDALGKPRQTPYEILHSQFPYEIAKKLCLVPLRLIEGDLRLIESDLLTDPLTTTFIVAVAHPEDHNTRKYLDNIDTYRQEEPKDPREAFKQACQMITYRVKVQTAPEEKIREAIDRFYSEEVAREEFDKRVRASLREMDKWDENWSYRNTDKSLSDPRD